MDVDSRLPSGRHDLDGETVSRSQRERLERAMIETVAEIGYGDTTITKVCSRAGVSKATFYELYSGREDAFIAAYDSMVMRLARWASEAFEQGASNWEEGIRSALEALLAFLAENEAFARVSFVEILGAGRRAIDRRHAVTAGFRRYFDPAHQPLMERWPDRPELVAEAVIDALYGMLYSRILEGRIADLPSCVDELTYVALLPYEGASMVEAEKS